jgi:hypothetical protein
MGTLYPIPIRVLLPASRWQVWLESSVERRPFFGMVKTNLDVYLRHNLPILADSYGWCEMGDDFPNDSGMWFVLMAPAQLAKPWWAVEIWAAQAAG